MLRTIVKIILNTLLMAGIAGVFGCAQQTALSKNWGRSFETARYNQTLNPEAEKNLEPVVGLEGPAAEHVMNDHYSAGSCDAKASSK